MDAILPLRHRLVTTLKKAPPLLTDREHPLSDMDELAVWLRQNFTEVDVEQLNTFADMYGERAADDLLLGAFREAALLPGPWTMPN